MKHHISPLIGAALLAMGAASCSDAPAAPDQGTDSSRVPMEFTFSHPSQSRATETAFESGDIVGLFVAEADKPLEPAGNAVNNESLTFTGSVWKAARTLYWDAGLYNVYAYYPRLGSIGSVTDLEFEVSADQRAEGYEASDLLHASAKAVQASDGPVNMQFRHIMSKITIRLIKGEDYEGELPETADVYIHNTVAEASVDLTAGVATKAVRGERRTVIARHSGRAMYSAIIVPQRLENRVPLIEVVMNGVSFLYESKFLFKPGMHHIVNLLVDKNPDQLKIEIGGEITDWY